MRSIERIVVDECLGRAPPILEQLRRRLENREVELVFLAVEHPGIPDVDILEKLLDARTALLTNDRVLHNHAISRGFRSFIPAPQDGLVEHRLPDVSARDNSLPASRGTIKESYVYRPGPAVQSILDCLIGFLSEKQLSQFRTKRRRIRAHFGSADNIAAAALTIGQQRTARGILGGYMLKLDARHGAKSLNPASESYFLDHAHDNEPLRATCWALVHLCWLQLQQYPITLYHLDRAALVRCAALLAQPDTARSPVERMAARLFGVIPEIKALECVKGRFFDRTNEKLNQLARFATNELVPADLRAMAATLSRSDAAAMSGRSQNQPEQLASR